MPSPFPRSVPAAIVLAIAALEARPAPASTDFTAEFRVKGRVAEAVAAPVPCGPTDAGLPGDLVLGARRPDPDVWGWGVSLAAGRVLFAVASASHGARTLCGTTAVLDGEWHDVAVRRAADGRLEIRVDGVLDATGEGPPGDVPVGPDQEPSSFDGRIEKVRVSIGPPGDVPRRGGDFRGLPDGPVVEARPDPARGDILLFVRWPGARTGAVAIAIHDVEGRPVARVDARAERGAALAVWDGRGDDGTPLPPGVYFARLEGEPARAVRFERPAR